MEKSNVQPLDKIPAGTAAQIVSIEAGIGLKNRLASMGLLVDVGVQGIHNDGAGQIIINVKNSKVILGRGMSHKIFVIKV